MSNLLGHLILQQLSQNAVKTSWAAKNVLTTGTLSQMLYSGAIPPVEQKMKMNNGTPWSE